MQNTPLRSQPIKEEDVKIILASTLGLGLLGLTLTTAAPRAEAKECADPPLTKAGRCSKASGGYCRSNGTWWTENSDAYKRCMSKGTKVYGYTKSKKKD